MAKIRNTSGDALDVPIYGPPEGVGPDEILEVPDSEVYSYTASANWEPDDDAADAAHAEGVEAEAVAVAAERVERASLGLEDHPDAGLDDQQSEGLPPPAQAAIVIIKQLDDAELLQQILDAEKALPKPRVTVVAAAEKRLKELTEA